MANMDPALTALQVFRLADRHMDAVLSGQRGAAVARRAHDALVSADWAAAEVEPTTVAGARAKLGEVLRWARVAAAESPREAAPLLLATTAARRGLKSGSPDAMRLVRQARDALEAMSDVDDRTLMHLNAVLRGLGRPRAVL